MTNMTLSIPEQLFEKMKAMREIRWSEIARQAFENKIMETDFEEKLLKKSKITQKDIEDISRKIKREVAQDLN
ncbi:hypothetical protein HYW75_02980 [Candidatus Pacearchaeota archaeon]|nr:hypothetical protein [Candidatus Pacearchaeota archaeon]